MVAHHVPGASVVVIRHGEIASMAGYGVLVAGGPEPVTPDTLFRVASISKHVAALGALRLAAQGRLDLDKDVNHYLRSWQLPDGGHAAAVTVRQLLGNVAGLSQYSRPDYRPGDPLPSTLDVLAGRPPARTPAVRVEVAPGTSFRSGPSNYFVLQQIMCDLTGESFSDLLRELVFTPLELAGTSFDPDFPHTSGRPVARGHDTAGAPVADALLVPAEYAVAGLWSTAPDLARIAREIRRARSGASSKILTQSLATQMTQPPSGASYALSTLVDDTGPDLEFGHAGEITGYRAMTIMQVRGGSGVVVLTNGESGKEVIKSVMLAVGREDPHFARGRMGAAFLPDRR
jgi:CubicO group peptidase (beta-lactamase class C family)